MAGISSNALAFGNPENKYKFNKGSELQNKEFSDGSGLELYATPLRTLDPQIGRWHQIDSKPDYAQSLYSSMGNNPILYNDPLGDTTVPGAGFWKNLVGGVKDGGVETAGFVRGLGTTQGWKNLGNGLLDMADRANPISPTGISKNIETGNAGVNYVSNIPNMSKDQIGHDLGYGLEKTAETLALSKGAGMVGKAMQVEIVNVTKTAGQLGREGMAAAGIEQNTTRIPSLTGKAEYRVPDGLTNTTLTEVKNVSKLSLTNQIKDYMQYSQQQGLNFELHVRSTSQLSKPLQQQITQGNITLKLLPGK